MRIHLPGGNAGYSWGLEDRPLTAPTLYSTGALVSDRSSSSVVATLKASCAPTYVITTNSARTEASAWPYRSQKILQAAVPFPSTLNAATFLEGSSSCTTERLRSRLDFQHSDKRGRPFPLIRPWVGARDDLTVPLCRRTSPDDPDHFLGWPSTARTRTLFLEPFVCGHRTRSTSWRPSAEQYPRPKRSRTCTLPARLYRD